MQHDRDESGEVERLVASCAERLARGELVDVHAELARIADPARRATALRELAQLGLAQEALGGAPPAPSRRLGDFELVAELGRGSMGVVYRARQIALDRPVAVKVVTGLATLDPRRVERFVREARTLARLAHPGIVPVITAGEQDGALYFAMELVDGTPLHAVTQGLAAVRPADRTIAHVADLIGEPWPTTDSSYLAWVARVVADAADALQYAHEQGVLHRDVKPANLMLTSRGVRLIDFGLARIAEFDSTLTSLGVVGSPAYLPPESIGDAAARPSAQGDVYSLGVVLYELLAGRPPFVADSTAALLLRIARGEPPPLRRAFPGLPRDLETICAKAIEGVPSHRYATAAAFARDLRAFVAFRPIAARPPALPRRAWFWLRRNPAVAVTLVLAVGVAAVLGGARIVEHLQRRAALRELSAVCARSLANGDAAGVAAAIDKLVAIDDSRPELPRWRAALAGLRLDSARALARDELAGFRDLHARLLERAAERDRAAAVMAVEPMPADEYLAALRIGQDCERLDAERGALFLRVTHMAEDARTAATLAGAPEHPDVRALLAELFVLEWRWAERSGNAEWARLCARRIRENDDAGSFVAELDAPGQVSLVAPPGRAVYLFRYRPRHEFSADDPSNRLVPVPCDAATLAELTDREVGVRPGDPCVVVVGATATRAAAGLETDDLIVGVEGRTAVSGLWIRAVQPGSPAEAAGVRPWDRLVSAAGTPLGCWADLRLAQVAAAAVELESEGGQAVRLTVPSDGTLKTRSGIEVGTLADLLAAVPPPTAVTLTVVRGDERLRVTLPAGSAIAVAAIVTAYPLWLTPRARLGTTPLPIVAVPPGDYLLAVGGHGGPPLRAPFRVEAGQSCALEVTDPPSQPPGADVVWIPGGTTRLTGASAAGTEHVVPPFWMDRFEVTLGDWDRFQQDPEVAAHIARELATSGRLVYTIRDEVEMKPRVYRQDPRARFPVKSISHEDARAFVDWRDRELQAAGSPWRASLPTLAEWELAARGFTQRALPWGDVFEPQLTEAHLTVSPPVLQPVGSRLGDESPYGVRDLAGSAAEATADPYRGIRDVYVVKGGSNQMERAADFAIASEDARPGSFVVSFLGLRVVYHLR
ncbi:MAG: protein kinase [Planctomycetes bacterium]|nr:protein kinase [Planctomycetota bacterium]